MSASPLHRLHSVSCLAFLLRQHVECRVEFLGLVFVVMDSELVVVRGGVFPLLVWLHIQHFHEGANLNFGVVVSQGVAGCLLANEETVFEVDINRVETALVFWLFLAVILSAVLFLAFLTLLTLIDLVIVLLIFLVVILFVSISIVND